MRHQRMVGLRAHIRYSVYAGIALVNFGLGEKLFAGLGIQPPAVYTWAVENRMQATMVMMGISQFGPVLLGVN